MNRPFWQEFAFEILKAVGVEIRENGETKLPVSNIEISVFGANRIPTVTVTFSPFEEHEIRPIVEIFQAAKWQNTRQT